MNLEFLKNEAGEDEGLGNAGIETYRDDPYASVAREVGQNSRDAGSGNGQAVRISFDLLTIPVGEIPGIEQLGEVIGLCLAKAEKIRDQKELEFFAQAQSRLSNESLTVLRISDYNTTGLKGPPVSGSPFNSLVKGSGVSRKKDDWSGGSFGIGKNAVFAITDLQTVLYSTIYEDEAGEKSFLCQGKSILVSHRDAEGVDRRQQGYWGAPGFSAISDPGEVPPWLRREEVGTSVFAVGFRESPDWQWRIVFSLIQNFYQAIHKDEMVFSVDNGRIVVNRETLRSLFEDPEVRAAVEVSNRVEEFSQSRQMFECLVSPDSKRETFEVPLAGKVEVTVLVKESMPKKVSILRNGMVITDTLGHFGDKFARFPAYSEFACVVCPLTREGSAFIKRLESPRHDSLSAERLPDAAARDRATKAMKAFAKEIRRIIRSHSLPVFEDEEAAHEMSDLFQNNSGDPADSTPSENRDPEEVRTILEPRKSKPPPAEYSDAEGEDTGEDDGPNPSPKPRPPGPEEGLPVPNPKPPGGGTRKAVRLADLRNRLPDPARPEVRELFFTPSDSGLAIVSVRAAGLIVEEGLRVVGAEGAAVQDGRISLSLGIGQRHRVVVTLEEPYAGPIEIAGFIETTEAVNED